MNTGHICIALLCASLTASAADYYVAEGSAGNYTAGNPGPSPLQASKLAVNAGDVIHVGPGTYSFQGETMFLAQGATIIGTTGNPDDVVITRVIPTITGTTNDRVIYAGYNSVLRNITVRGGYTAYQAAVVCGYDAAHNVHKVFSVSNCIIENGSAQYDGGGSYGGTWRDCIIRNCTVRSQGINQNGTTGSSGGIFGATLYNCIITNNTAGYVAGGVGGHKNHPTYAEGCLIGWNTAPYGGGAGVTGPPPVGPAQYCQLVNCTIVSNLATSCAGQTFGGAGGGTFFCTLTNCTVRGNRATYPSATSSSGRGGGGVSYSLVYDCDILDNKATNLAGNDFHVCGGGAEYCHLENCRLIGNEASGYGGATISSTNINCWISGNWAATAGAMLSSLLRNCVISNNWTTSFQGGAAYNSSTYNCLVIHNRSKKGAVLFQGYHEGDLVISNSVESVDSFSAGSAISPSDGTKAAGCNATAVNCTLIGNSGGDSALWAVYATNCLVVGNSPVDVKWMTLANTCMWVTDNNPSRPDETVAPAINCTKIADPKFVVEPRANECPYSLRMASPCRDQGIYFDWMEDAVDILGNPRVNWGKVDIGALECYGHLGLGVIIR